LHFENDFRRAKRSVCEDEKVFVDCGVMKARPHCRKKLTNVPEEKKKQKRE